MEKEAIMSTLDDYALAYCNKDIDALMKTRQWRLNVANTSCSAVRR